MNQKKVAALLITLVILSACSSENSPISYPVSSSTYNELNQSVGCDSKYIEEKK